MTAKMNPQPSLPDHLPPLTDEEAGVRNGINDVLADYVKREGK
jgi:hypothetical protein